MAVGELLAGTAIEAGLSLMKDWISFVVKKGLGTAMRRLEISRQFSQDCDAADRLLSYSENAFSFSEWLQNDLQSQVVSAFASEDPDFISVLHKYLLQKAVECKIDSITAERVANIFVRSYASFLKKRNPDAYRSLKISESLSRLDKQLSTQITMLRDIQSGLSLLTKESRSYLSPEEWFDHIESNTVNPSIGMDYFCVDNEAFINSLFAKLSSNYFAISYYCMEEAVGCVCNTLLRMNLHRFIFIVENKKTWESLREQKPSGMILLAAFESEEEVPAILKNTCIYFSSEARQTNMDVLELPKRKLSSLKTYLIDAGADSDRAISLIERTNGIYYSLMSFLTKGKARKYTFSHEYDDVIQTYLLFPTIPDSEEAYSFVKSITGIDQQRLRSASKNLLKGKDPLLIKRKSFAHQESYQLASIERAWYQYGCDQETFANLLKALFAELEKGVPRVLSQRALGACLKSISLYVSIIDPTVQSLADSLLKNLLKQALRRPDILYDLLDYAYLFVQISPDGLLDFLEERKADVLEVMNNHKALNYVPHIAHALLKALYYKDSSRRSMHVAFSYASSFLEKSNVGPHFQDVVKEYFIPWFNVSGQTPGELIQDARTILASNKALAWDILNQAAHADHGEIKSVSVSYRRENDEFGVSWSDYCYLENAYFDLLCDTADARHLIELLRWSKVPSNALKWESLEQAILSKSSGLTDEELYDVAYHIYELVNDARKYDREWCQGEGSQAFLNRIWEIADSLPYSNKAFRYLRALIPDRAFPLLQPAPYNNEKDFSEEQETFKQNRLLIWQRAQEDGVTFSALCVLCKTVKNKDLLLDPLEFAVSISDSKFCLSIFSDLSETGYLREAARYAASLASSDTVLELCRTAINEELAAELLSTQPIDSTIMSELKNKPIEFRRLFWSIDVWGRRIDSQVAMDAINDCELCGEYGLALEFLMRAADNLSLSEVLGGIYRITNQKPETIHEGLNDYYVEEYLQKHRNEILADNDLLYLASLLEMGSKKNYCSNQSSFIDEAFSVNPNLFLLILSMVYLDDDGGDAYVGERNEALSKNAFGILWNSRFCPGYCNGLFDAGRFESWMSFAKEEAKKKKLTTALFIGLGKAVSHAKPADGLPFPKEVCAFVEGEKNDVLDGGIETGLFNLRGIHSFSAGAEEAALSAKYRIDQKSLEAAGFLRCAKIFRRLADSYEGQASYERETAQTEFL